MGDTKRRGRVLFAVGCGMLVTSVVVGGLTIADAAPPNPPTVLEQDGVTTVLADERLSFPGCPPDGPFFNCQPTVTKTFDISGQKELTLYVAETATGCPGPCFGDGGIPQYSVDIKVVAPSGRTWNLDSLALQDLTEQSRKWSAPGTQLRLTFQRQLGSCTVTGVFPNATVDCSGTGTVDYTLAGRDN